MLGEGSNKNKKKSVRKSSARGRVEKKRRYESQHRLEHNKMKRVLEHNGSEAAVVYAKSIDESSTMIVGVYVLRSMAKLKPGYYKRAMEKSERFRRYVSRTF